LLVSLISGQTDVYFVRLGSPKGGFRMRRFRWTLLISCLFVAANLNADTIPIFNITSVDIVFNPGGGMFFSLDAPGVSITGDGFFGCTIWCNPLSFESTGFPIDITNLTTVDYFAQLRGKTFSALGAFSSPWSLTFGDFSVPGGQVPAVLNNGLILGTVSNGNRAFKFFLKLPPGTLQLQFLSDPEFPDQWTFLDGEFSASRRTTVPEPGTMALTATGLAAIVGLVRKKRSPSWR